MNRDEVRASIKAERQGTTDPLPPSADIVDRLRERAGQYDECDWHGAIEREAADEIERLRGLHGGQWKTLLLDYPDIAAALEERFQALEARIDVLDRPVK